MTKTDNQSASTDGLLIYALVVLIGTPSWFFTKLQARSIPVATSVAYRFAFAALLLVVFCLITRKSLRFKVADHLRFFVIGATMFSVNYFFLYVSTKYVASGVVAIIYSTLVLMNVALGYVLFRVSTSLATTVGALIGVVGISVIFLHEMSQHGAGSDVMRGLLLAMLGTFLTSIGNVAAQQTYKRGLPVVQTTTFSMGYGGLLLLAAAIWRGQLVFDFSPVYVGSLFYLVVFNSAIGLVLYIAMIGKLGAGKAAYVNIICPVLAMGISAVFENSELSGAYFAGAGLIIAGNVLSIIGKQWGAMSLKRSAS